MSMYQPQHNQVRLDRKYITKLPDILNIPPVICCSLVWDYKMCKQEWSVMTSVAHRGDTLDILDS